MKKLLFLLSAFILITGCSKDEEDLSGTISGLVTDYSNANEPIAGVSITLDTKGITKTTGKDGRFEFTDLEPGTYTLQAKADMFQATTKQVTVYAKQTVTCDFQLEKATQSKSITINPKNVVIGGNMEQNSFEIVNNLNQSVDFILASLPSFITASVNKATISAKGKMNIILTAVDRQNITMQRTGQFTVNVGNDSYIVNITVEPYQTEQLNVLIMPTYLLFDKTKELLSFTITSNNTYAHSYAISSDLSALTVMPTSGTLKPGATQTITISVNNRQSITEELNGQLTIDFGGSTRVVMVKVLKYGEDQDKEEISVTRGLQIFYNFNDETADNVYLASDNGTLMGDSKPSFITDTPSGKGKALFMGSQQYVNIPNNALSGKKTFSIGMWVKDFGTGSLISSISSYVTAPSLYVTAESKLRVWYYGDSYSIMKSSLADYQSSGWHHLIVTGGNSTVNLYVDGKKVDSESIGTMLLSGTKYQIGGNADNKFSDWADAMKIDNVRIHSVMLSDSEVKQIYDAEKQ